MALVPTISISQARDGTTLDITDSTGSFNVVTSSTAYGVSRTSGTITVDTATEIFTLAAHGMASNEPINLTNLGVMTGLYMDQLYYIVSPTTNTFQLALTANGTAINVSNSGGTSTGTFDFVRGWRTAAGVNRTVYKINLYSDSTINYSDYLSTGTFIPQGTTTDSTTLDAEVVNDGTAGDPVDDGVYGVTMIPIWTLNTAGTWASDNLTFNITGPDISALYSGYEYFWLTDGTTDYLYEIDDITYAGGISSIVITEETDLTGSFTTANFGLGKGATFTYLAYYNTLSCWQSKLANLTIQDIEDCKCSKPTQNFEDADLLNITLQAAIASRNCANYTNAQELIELAEEICDRDTSCTDC